MYVLTNGTHYIQIQSGGHAKGTNNIGEATKFMSEETALATLKKCPSKSETFFPAAVENGKAVITKPKAKKKKKVKPARKTYSPDVRKLIYIKDNGTCQLCGRKISLEEMTLDHVTPLAMNGADDVENLQCTCLACNQFKGSILPDEFQNRISEIFMYHMEKQNGGKLRWKIASKLLAELANEN